LASVDFWISIRVVGGDGFGDEVVVVVIFDFDGGEFAGDERGFFRRTRPSMSGAWPGWRAVAVCFLRIGFVDEDFDGGADEGGVFIED